MTEGHVDRILTCSGNHCGFNFLQVLTLTLEGFTAGRLSYSESDWPGQAG
jgi:hypothetical protein